jgi:hypothetical protein
VEALPGQKARFESIEIEDPCSKLQGIFDRKEVCHFEIRSVTPQQAAGNALAFAVQTHDEYRPLPLS